MWSVIDLKESLQQITEKTQSWYPRVPAAGMWSVSRTGLLEEVPTEYRKLDGYLIT